MSRTLRYLLLMLLVIIITCILQWFFCCKNVDPVPPVITKQATHLPFDVVDANGNLSLHANDNFNFKKSSFNYLTPLSGVVDSKIDELKNYMNANQGKTLTVTGYYTTDEKNTSSFDNLGIARAEDIKKFLIDKGIPENTIITVGKLKDDMVADTKQIYHGPVAFSVNGGEKKIDANALLAEINKDPLTFYFNTNEFYTGISSADKVKLDRILMYLNKVNDASCLVVGHTDNVGSLRKNFDLGKRRANFGRNVLSTNGILTNRIKTVSKGLTSPAFSNDSEEGRSRNRRTVITIK